MSSPYLVLGLGGLGWEAAKRCRAAYRQLPEDNRLPAAFLGIDVSTTPNVDDPDLILLEQAEVQDVLAHLDLVVDGEAAWSRVLSWFPDRSRFVHLPTRPAGTGRSRPVGRLALWVHSHADRVRHALWRRLDELRGRASSSEVSRNPVLLVLSSAWGGSGSAWISDIAAMARSLGPLGGVEILLTLPGPVAVPGPRAIESQNTFATLVDLQLLGGTRFRLEADPINGRQLTRDDLDDWTPFLLARPAGRPDDTPEALRDIVVARLTRPLAQALDEHRGETARVGFVARSSKPRLLFNTCVAIELPLAKVEANTLRERLEPEMHEMGIEPFLPSSTTSVGAERRRLEAEILSLLRKPPGLPEQLDALLEDLANQDNDNEARLPPTSELPWLKAPQELADLETLQPIFDALERPGLGEELDELALRSSTRFEDLSTTESLDDLDRRIDELATRIRDLGRPFEEEPSTAASWRQAWAEMQSFERRLDNAPAWRRLAKPDSLLRRNNRLRRRIVLEAIRGHSWREVLAPIILAAVLRRLRRHLEIPATSPDTQSKDSSWRELEKEASDEPAEEPTLPEGTIAENAGSSALRQALDRGLAIGRIRELVESLQEAQRGGRPVLLPDPARSDLDAAVSACRPEVFTTRLDTTSSRHLIALVPDRLIWPEGPRALQEAIEIRGREVLGAETVIVPTPGERLVFYLEERGQSIHNLEPLSRYREAYEQHPSPETLHVDRRIIGAPEARRLLALGSPGNAESTPSSQDDSDPLIS